MLGLIPTGWRLAAALGGLAAILVLGVLLKLAWAENGALEAKLASANAVIEQREKDSKANAVAVAQLAQKLNDTETKVITVTEKIYAAPVTRECAASPSMRAASDGVRTLIYGPKAGDSAKPAAPVH